MPVINLPQTRLHRAPLPSVIEGSTSSQRALRPNPGPCLPSPSTTPPTSDSQPYRPSNGWSYSAIPPRACNGVHFDLDDAESRGERQQEMSPEASERRPEPPRAAGASCMDRAPSQQAMNEADRRSVMRRRHQEARQRQEEHIAFAQSRNVFAKEKKKKAVR